MSFGKLLQVYKPSTIFSKLQNESQKIVLLQTYFCNTYNCLYNIIFNINYIKLNPLYTIIVIYLSLKISRSGYLVITIDVGKKNCNLHIKDKERSSQEMQSKEDHHSSLIQKEGF